MNQEVMAPIANLPAHLQAACGSDAAKEFTAGVQSGFPIISYRGKTWRVKQGGEEQVYVDENGDAIQTIEVVMIRSNERLSKTHYEGNYNEGDKEKPRCWSANGMKADADVENPINITCKGCPMDVWGSRTTDNGTKTKACQDVRRVSVIFQHELEMFERGEKTFDELSVMLLRIPPATLNVLKAYVEKVLNPKGLPPFVLSTKIGFDTDASYPKLTFKGGRFLSESEFGAVSALRESDIVTRILDTSSELADAGTTEGGGDAVSSESNTTTEAPPSAPAEVSQPNTEEAHFSEAIEPAPDAIAPAPVAPATVVAPAPVAPAPVAVRPAAVEEQAAQIEQPPQATVVTPKPVAPSPAPVVGASPSTDPAVEDMLSSILD